MPPATQYPVSEIAAGLLVALGQADGLVDVGITAGFPGDAIKAEAVWIGEPKTVFAYPTYRDPDGRRRRVLTTTIPLEANITTYPSDDTATLLRLGEIIGAIDDTVADGPLIGSDGTVLDLVLADVAHFVLVTPEGYLGMALINLTITTQLD